jgi:hypothetical protein
LAFFAIEGSLIIALSIHFQVARWPIASFGLQPDVFNGTNAGSYDSSSNTINATGVFIAPVLNYAGIVIGSITAVVSFPM